MSFDLTQKIKIVNPHSNIDELYGVYNSVAEALTGVPLVLRQKGRTVGVLVGGSVVEYWFKDGITDADLVLKGGNGDSSNLTLEQARINGNVLEGDVLFDENSNIGMSNTTGNLYYRFYSGDGFSEIGGALNLLTPNGFFNIGTSPIGIQGNLEFNKQGDRKAFAQLSDVYDANSYSTTETKTGGTWIDGKPIYRKVFTGQTLSNSPRENLNLGLDELNIESRIKIKMIGEDGGGYVIENSNRITTINPAELVFIINQYGFSYDLSDNDIVFFNNKDIFNADLSIKAISEVFSSNIINFKIILEYTKTTD